MNGEKGCDASHIRLWQQLLASGAPAMVVLEDDVGLKDGFADILGAISQRAQPWDMVKLIGRERDSFRGSCPLSEGVELVDYKRVPSMTAGYAISRQGAQKLCQSRLPSCWEPACNRPVPRPRSGGSCRGSYPVPGRSA